MSIDVLVGAADNSECYETAPLRANALAALAGISAFGRCGETGPERRLITHSGRKNFHSGGARCLLGCTGSVPVGALAYWHCS